MLQPSVLPIRHTEAVLRTMRAGDAAAFAAGTEDIEVRRYAHLPESEYTEQSVLALIRGPVREGLDRGDLAVLTIADPSTDVFVGSLVLFGATARSIEVGFWIHPEHRGRHLSVAALGLATEFVRRSGFSEVTARTVPANAPSHRALDRSGFVRGEPMRDTAPSGESVDLLPYRRPVEPVTLFPLTTERLRLRLHDHADAQPLQRIYGQADVARYLLDEPWSAANADRRVSERMAHTGLGDGRSALAVVIELGGVAIGDVTLWLTDPEQPVAEIGWVLDPEYGGQGLASEAVRAVLEAAFTEYRLHRVAAQMDARNAASAALARRVGMKAEAHLRRNWWSKGEWTDTIVYGALAEDEQIPPSTKPVRRS